MLCESDNKHTGTTIKVSDGVLSEQVFDLLKGDEVTTKARERQ
jgi:hypothetical protein